MMFRYFYWEEKEKKNTKNICNLQIFFGMFSHVLYIQEGKFVTNDPFCKLTLFVSHVIGSTAHKLAFKVFELLSVTVFS